MDAVISLKEVIDALEMVGDETTSYLDPATGEIFTVIGEYGYFEDDEEDWEEDEGEESQEERREADLSQLPLWQQEYVTQKRAFMARPNLVVLPDKFEIHEWAIMEEFARAQTKRGVREQLLNAVHGNGAFRHFKGAVRRLNIEQDWYRFRDEAIADIAREWLDEQDLPYKD